MAKLPQALPMFVIEDAIHADEHRQFKNLADAMAELRRRAAIPWDQDPNRAPCTSWRTCGRWYVLAEYDDTQTPWKELRRMAELEISKSGVKWREQE